MVPESLSDVKCIACSIFKNELEKLQRMGKLEVPVIFLDSMLHMKPVDLTFRLNECLHKELSLGHRIILLYGDCHPYTVEQESVPGVVRVTGINCPAILLGRETYRSLRKEGVFFLMHEWATRWQEIFKKQLGLDPTIAGDFMKEMHSRLVYLDTGLLPVPNVQLNELSQYTGLTWDVLRVNLDALVVEVRDALKRLNETSAPSDDNETHIVGK
jgi:hypothetical protein